MIRISFYIIVISLLEIGSFQYFPRSFPYPLTRHSVSSRYIEDELELQSEKGYDGYCAAGGFESIVVSVGNRRSLLSCEYQAIFRLFPGILNIYRQSNNSFSTQLSNLWPVRNRSNFSQEIEIVFASEREDQRILFESNLALKYIGGNITSSEKESLVVDALAMFRKVILGVEKYRINNPGRIGAHYCTMLRACLDTNTADDFRGEWWGAAANALQYAGLSFRDHVTEPTCDSTSRALSIPIISLDSLWSQALIRLLDLGESEAGDATWDQKYFSQIQCSTDDEENIQDMMLGVMRVAVCAVLSSTESSTVRLRYRRYLSGSG